MYTYKIGLQTGGIMENPKFFIDYIESVEALDLDRAKDEWGRVTGEDKKSTWNFKNKTVWGWRLVCLKTDDPNCEVVDINDIF